MSRRPAPIGEVLDYAPRDKDGTPKRYLCAADCGAVIGHPGVCAKCSVLMLRREAENAARRKVEQSIPAVYWTAELSDDKASRIIRSWLAGCVDVGYLPGWQREIDRLVESGTVRRDDIQTPPALVIRGATHVLKSRRAAAAIRYAIDLGTEASFVPAHKLSPEADRGVYARSVALCRQFKRLVAIDDIASVLGGAPAGGGVAAMRAGELQQIMRLRWEHRARTIYTLAMTDEQIDAALGEDIKARLTDPMASIVLHLGPR